LENIKLAENHLCFKWTSVDPDVEMSEIVGSIDVASVSPSVVSNTLLFLIDTLGMTYDLVTAVATADAAGENMSVFKSLATHSVGEFLPESLTSLFPDIDFSEKNLMINFFLICPTWLKI
jgi:hypothetical protein